MGAAHDGEGGDDGVGEGEGAALERGGVSRGVRGDAEEVGEEGGDHRGEVGVVHVRGDEVEAAEGAGDAVGGGALADGAHERAGELRPLLGPVPLGDGRDRHAHRRADLPGRVAQALRSLVRAGGGGRQGLAGGRRAAAAGPPAVVRRVCAGEARASGRSWRIIAFSSSPTVGGR